MSSVLEQDGIKVQGEIAPDFNEILTPEALAFLAKLHRAFNPRRLELLKAREERQAKLDAGATALFSQPLFDLRFMELCADQLPGVQIYWGVSPVIRVGSRRRTAALSRRVNRRSSLGKCRAFGTTLGKSKT